MRKRISRMMSFLAAPIMVPETPSSWHHLGASEITHRVGEGFGQRSRLWKFHDGIMIASDRVLLDRPAAQRLPACPGPGSTKPGLGCRCAEKHYAFGVNLAAGRIAQHSAHMCIQHRLQALAGGFVKSHPQSLRLAVE